MVKLSRDWNKKKKLCDVLRERKVNHDIERDHFTTKGAVSYKLADININCFQPIMEKECKTTY